MKYLYILFISIIIGIILGNIIKPKHIYHGTNSNIIRQYKYYIDGTCYNLVPVKLKQ